MTLSKRFWLWTSGLVILLAGIGLFVFLWSRDTTVCDPLGGKCHDINEAPEDTLAVLIHSSNTGIDVFNPSTNTSSPLITTRLGVSAVSMDKTYAYWYNYYPGTTGIYRALKNGTSEEIIAFMGTDSVREISVDWITGNIYFFHRSRSGIKVCMNSGSYCTAIRNSENLKSVEGLVLHPTTGMMYWSNSHIFKSEMNGKSQVSFVSDDIGSPAGLAIDYLASRLYWVDTNKQIVESINLDGTDRKTVVNLIEIPRSIAVYGSRLFWIEEATNSIFYCDKSTGQGKNTLLRGNGLIQGMHIHDPALKPDPPNPCDDNPCEEICLLAANRTYTCACSPDKILKDDGKTCEEIKGRYGELHLIVSAGGVLYDYHHGVLGKPHFKIINDSYQFAEVYGSANLSRNDNQILFDEFSRFSRHNGTLGGIAFDDIGRNLYWTNPERKTIEIMSLTTLKNTSIQLSEEPRSILLLPTSSDMIVTTCKNNRGCSVNRMSKAGDGGESLRYFSGDRVSLAFGRGTGFLMTDDGGVIEKIDTDPESDFREAIYAPKSVVSLAALEDDVFWTEKDTKKIFWITTRWPNSYRVKKIGLEGFNVTIPTDVDVMHLIQTIPNYESSRTYHYDIWKDHKCRVNNGGCSHVCLLKSEDSRVCRCPSHMILNDDQKTCRSL